MEVCKVCGKKYARTDLYKDSRDGLYTCVKCQHKFWEDFAAKVKKAQNIDFGRLEALLIIIQDSYPQHQKRAKKCLCEACQGLWILKGNK